MGFTYSGARVAPLATDVHVRQEPDEEEEEEDEDDHKEEDDDDDDNGDGYSE
jgi:ribosomal protein L12E/L44/L45/RPP1/RPP2